MKAGSARNDGPERIDEKPQLGFVVLQGELSLEPVGDELTNLSGGCLGEPLAI